MRNKRIYEVGQFEDWVVDTMLCKLLEPKEVKLFKGMNMTFNDLKLFGVGEEEKSSLIYEWTIYKRKGVGDNWGTYKSQQYIDEVRKVVRKYGKRP